MIKGSSVSVLAYPQIAFNIDPRSPKRHSKFQSDHALGNCPIAITLQSFPMSKVGKVRSILCRLFGLLLVELLTRVVRIATAVLQIRVSTRAILVLTATVSSFSEVCWILSRQTYLTLGVNFLGFGSRGVRSD